MKALMIWLYRQRMKFHYLGVKAAIEDLDCGHEMALYISTPYRTHYTKMLLYRTRLKHLGENI